MKFRINYFFERDNHTFVCLSRNGKLYDRPCKVLGDGTPVFKFLGRQWYGKTPIRRVYD